MTTVMAVVRMVARVAVILFSSLLPSLFPQEFMEKAGAVLFASAVTTLERPSVLE